MPVVANAVEMFTAALSTMNFVGVEPSVTVTVSPCVVQVEVLLLRLIQNQTLKVEL